MYTVMLFVLDYICIYVVHIQEFRRVMVTLNVQNLIFMLKSCLGFLVDTLFCVARLSIFIHDCSVSFLVVVILSVADHCHIPTYIIHVDMVKCLLCKF